MWHTAQAWGGLHSLLFHLLARDHPLRGASAGSTGVPGREWASGPTLLLLKEGCLPFTLGGWNGTTWKAGKAERNVSKEALSPLWTWSWDQEFILPVPIPPLVAEASVP